MLDLRKRGWAGEEADSPSLNPGPVPHLRLPVVYVVDDDWVSLKLLLCFVCKTLTSTTCAESLAQRHPFCTQKSFFSPLLGRQNSLLPQKCDFPCSWEWPRDLLQYRILPSVRLFPGPQGAPEAAAAECRFCLTSALVIWCGPRISSLSCAADSAHGFSSSRFYQRDVLLLKILPMVSSFPY